MKILFINNDGAGFANHIEIEADTTVQSLFNQRIGEGKEVGLLEVFVGQSCNLEDRLYVVIALKVEYTQFSCD